MGTAVVTRDVLAVLDIVARMNGAGDDGTLLRSVLSGTTDLVACDTVSYNEQDAGRRQEERYLIEPTYAERTRIDAAYHRHLGQHPVFAAINSGRLAPGRSVAVSDLMSSSAFRALPLYAEYYRQREVEDQLIVLVGAQRGRTRLMAVSRSRRGFGVRDRALVELLAPHLQHALRYRRRIAELTAAVALRGTQRVDPARWQALTRRELDVVECVASGATDQRIGRVLGISRRTVGKHLENVYRKLELPGRTALVAALTDPSGVE